MKFVKENEDGKGVGLSLVETIRGKIELWATDENGRHWDIMIFENGKFERVRDISDNIGIEVDDKGRIIEDN